MSSEITSETSTSLPTCQTVNQRYKSNVMDPDQTMDMEQTQIAQRLSDSASGTATATASAGVGDSSDTNQFVDNQLQLLQFAPLLPTEVLHQQIDKTAVMQQCQWKYPTMMDNGYRNDPNDLGKQLDSVANIPFTEGYSSLTALSANNFACSNINTTSLPFPLTSIPSDNIQHSISNESDFQIKSEMNKDDDDELFALANEIMKQDNSEFSTLDFSDLSWMNDFESVPAAFNMPTNFGQYNTALDLDSRGNPSCSSMTNTYPDYTTPTSHQQHKTSTVTPETSCLKQLLLDLPMKEPESYVKPINEFKSDSQSSKHFSNETTKPSTTAFHIDKTKLSTVPLTSQSSELSGLGLTVFNQEQLEQDIIAQVDEAMETEEQERRKKMKEKEMTSVNDDIKSCLSELQKSEKVLDMLKAGKNVHRIDLRRKILSVRNQMKKKIDQMERLRVKKKSLLSKQQNNIEQCDSNDLVDNDCKLSAMDVALSKREAADAVHSMNVEEKIRRGEMTPFGTVMDFSQKKDSKMDKQKTSKVMLSKNSEFDKYLLGQAQKNIIKKKTTEKSKNTSNDEKKVDNKSKKVKTNNKEKPVLNKRHREENLFDRKDKRRYKPNEKDFSNYKPSKKASFARLQHNFSGDGRLSDHECGDEDEMYDEHLNADDDYVPNDHDLIDSDVEGEWSINESIPKKKLLKKKMHGNKDGQPSASKKIPLNKINSRDDGNKKNYEARIKKWNQDHAQKKYEKLQLGELDSDDDSDVELDGGFKVPGSTWNKLYNYQKTGVRWLWELHGQQAGGIIGDEMGLGKTIQVIAFLSGLTHSRLKDSTSKYRGLGPTVIVAPTTVMHQWVREIHKWAPMFRVAVLHNTGSYTSSEESLVYNMVKCNSIIVTSFSSVVVHQEILLKYNWHYVILDEGHKIRNPDAQVTVACKQFRTCHRIILSGSPVQNNLKELWSLFDFVFPGKLGTLPDFMAHFSVPIVQGGYSNATQVQVQTAYKCACVLRDTINPYLLRRMKNDVKDSLQLPPKNEQVLFCRLTDEQKDVYQEYIDSRECQEILRGNFMVFPGLITLRKICNHPDLSTGGPSQFNPNFDSMSEKEQKFGHCKRSGKMIVVQTLLRLWHKQGHRVLLFSQGTQMLNILENLMQQEHYEYMRMDGGTSIGARQNLIEKFNQTSSIFVFLLTTRVGGVGVNLCGANRVILFDPDWNPSTDTQARERAWRIGQTRQVTIYRLLTTGTIEEKIYHRQIFKQFLTNRVLKDPKQRRFFKSNDMFELFTLSSDDPKHGTETGAIFAGTGSDISVKCPKEKKSKEKNRFDEMKARGDDSHLDIDCDEEEKKSKELQERLEKMREFAKKLSHKMEQEKMEEENKRESRQDNELVQGNETIKSGELLSSNEKVKTLSSNDQCKKSESKSSHHLKKKHKKDKKSRKVKDAKFEGERISHLTKHSTYNHPTEEDQDNEAKLGDDYVLKRLFKKSGVHSALQHDTIMMSSNPDFALVESEAEKVAKEAAAALKKSRAHCYSANSGIPTWTGQSGKTAPAKPRFGQKKNPTILENKAKDLAKVKTSTSSEKAKNAQSLFDGSIAGNKKTTTSGASTVNVMTSTELLSKMRQRNYTTIQSTNEGNDEEQSATNISEVNSETMEFITDIRNYIAFGAQIDGQASTQELLDEFASKIPSNESAKFKAMLKEICSFRRHDGIGTWRLKNEFR